LLNGTVKTFLMLHPIGLRIMRRPHYEVRVFSCWVFKAFTKRELKLQIVEVDFNDDRHFYKSRLVEGVKSEFEVLLFTRHLDR